MEISSSSTEVTEILASHTTTSSNGILAAIIIALSVPFLTQNAFAGGIKGKVRLSDRSSSAGTVVYIEHVDSTFKPPADPVVMDQKDMKFIPHVLAIVAGTTVKFTNSDNVLHNVFTPSQCAGSFDLGTWPKGESRSHVFTEPDCFSIILCNVHPQMQAWIAVLQNPYYTMVNKDGSFEIRNVPARHYLLKAWHGFYQDGSAEVDVTESGTVVENFTLQR